MSNPKSDPAAEEPEDLVQETLGRMYAKWGRRWRIALFAATNDSTAMTEIKQAS